MKVYIGIDNGVSGSIGLIGKQIPMLFSTPVILQQDYTKKKKNLNRLNVHTFNGILMTFSEYPVQLAILERPMINPMRFQASISAVRCLEAQLCILESMEIPYMFVDSKQWQKALLPQGCKKEQLKKASHDIGIRLFPHLKETIEKLKDADGILIAEWARRMNL